MYARARRPDAVYACGSDAVFASAQLHLLHLLTPIRGWQPMWRSALAFLRCTQQPPLATWASSGATWHSPRGEPFHPKGTHSTLSKARHAGGRPRYWQCIAGLWFR